MKPTERNANSPFTPKTGVLATLGGPFRAIGTGAPSAPRRTSLGLAPLLALAAITACLVPSSALALKTHIFKAAFGEPGSGDGQLSLQAFAGSGLAVNEATHDVYVADTGNHRVDQFSAAGTFIRAFGADVGGAGVNVCTLGCVAGTPGTTPGAFEAPTFIAVDNSASASHGDVYVADASTSVVSKFEADGTLISSWGVGGQLDGSAAESPPEPFPGPFAQIVGIAVDASGNLDVLENAEHALFRFAPGSSLLSDFETPRGSAPAGLAVDSSGGDIFKVNGEPSVERFEGSGLHTDIGQVTASVSSTGLAVDGSGGELELFVDNGGSIDDYVFEPSGKVVGSSCAPAPGGCPPTDTFGTKDLTAGAGLAVDGASETVYAADPGTNQIVGFVATVLPEVATEAATEVDHESATLHGTLTAAGGPEASCQFQYITEAAFLANKEANPSGDGFEGSTNAPCSPPGPFTGIAKEALSAKLSGLASGTSYRFRIVASSENGSVAAEARSLFTPGPPIISNESVPAISATAAKVNGLIDPVGSPTSFVVQYVTAAEFLKSGYANATSVPVPAQQVGTNPGPIAVTHQLTGLTPDTAYHYRLLATNQVETVAGADNSFTTFVLAPPGLPDGRVYEMVSPPRKAGEVFPPEPAEEVGSSCPVECLPGALKPSAPMQSSPDGEVVVYEGQAFSGGLGGAANEYLSSRVPGGWGTEGLSSPLFESSENQGYKAFSTDLSRAVVYQIDPALSPAAPTREGKSFANLYLRENGTLQPLVTTVPPQRTAGRLPLNTRFVIVYGGANSGTASSLPLSHVLFAANDALTAASAFAPKAPEVEASGAASPGCIKGENCNLYEWVGGQLRLVNVLPGNATAASGAVIGSRLSNDEPPAVDHAISADGARIFWSDQSGQVFVRIDGEETQKIEDPGRFLTASADGSQVLLGDGCLYDLQAKACEDLTKGQDGFQGILGAADDLSRVYFVDTAVLTGGEENADHEHAKEGEFNLYAWHEGAIAFIGTLFEADNPNIIGDWKPSSTRRTAQVSPDGRYLTFMSKAPLTGYDNNLKGGGQCLRHSATSACFEVFEFDAGSASLTCASCNPSGQRPIGESNLSLIKESDGEASAPSGVVHGIRSVVVVNVPQVDGVVSVALGPPKNSRLKSSKGSCGLFKKLAFS